MSMGIGGKTLLIVGIAGGALLSGLITMAAWAFEHQRVDAIGTATLVAITGLGLGVIIGLRIGIKLINFTKLDPSLEKGAALASSDSYLDALNLVKKYDKESAVAELEKRLEHWQEQSEKYFREVVHQHDDEDPDGEEGS